jgi:hypothetical protein
MPLFIQIRVGALGIHHTNSHANAKNLSVLLLLLLLLLLLQALNTCMLRQILLLSIGMSIFYLLAPRYLYTAVDGSPDWPGRVAALLIHRQLQHRVVELEGLKGGHDAT